MSILNFGNFEFWGLLQYSPPPIPPDSLLDTRGRGGGNCNCVRRNLIETKACISSPHAGQKYDHIIMNTTSPAPHEPYPVELPLPDSPPPLSPHLDNVRTLNSALKDGVVSPSIDVHIRWVVESGSIVNVGEKIAELYYAFHSTPPPLGKNDSPPMNSRANTNSKKRKQRGGRGRKRTRNNGEVSLDHNFTRKDVRSPSSGFLRVLFKKQTMLDAVQVTLFGASGIEMTVIKLILAAIEPCEHPAMVGGLCVVCGADPRAPTTTTRQVHQSPRRKLFKDVSKSNQSPRKNQTSSPNQSPDIDPEQVKKKQILEKQKQVASFIASSSAQDAELGNFNVDDAIKTMSTDTVAKAPIIQESKPLSTAKPTAVRSLSSLLSGATATQKLQDPPPNQSMVSQQRLILNRPRQTNLLPSTSPNAHEDSNMSKMTVSGGVTIAISEAEAKSISEASSKKLREEKKLCLVLDLDHTLLHATDDYGACRFVADELLLDNSKEMNTIPTTIPNPEKRQDVRSILLPVELPPFVVQQYVHQKNQQQMLVKKKYSLSALPQQRQDANDCIIMRHFIKLRPYLKEFFDQVQSTYQLSIYTAGTRAYAEQVALMICRHLVGAMLDEEGLNELRSKVKQKDDEFRRYKANVERMKQLQLAKASTAVVEANDEAQKKKVVSFDVVSDGGITDVQGVAETESVKPPRCQMQTNSNGDERNPVRKQRLAFATWTPPRSKKTESGNDEAELMRNTQLTEKEQLVDPSEDRDRLRKELKESEELELQAIELRRKLFGSRIVSRTDVGDLGKEVKSLKRVFPCGGVMVRRLNYWPLQFLVKLFAH